MKNRLTFLLIASRTGAKRRFSINKKIFYSFVFFLVLMAGAGSAGLWKAQENLELAQKKRQLEGENQQMQTIAKKVKVIEREETALRNLLGLDNKAQEIPSEPDEG